MAGLLLSATGSSMKTKIRIVRPLAALWLAAGFASACAEEVPVDVQQGDDTGGTGGTGGGNFLIDDDETLPPAGTGGSGTIDGKDRECGPPSNNASCAGQVFAGKSIPLDIFIMFDQSGSMCACLDQGAGQLCLESGCNTTRLDAVRDAIGQFVADPNNDGVGVGLGLFGQQEIGETSCDVAVYEEPTVPVGTLPGQAAQFTTALERLAPTGETPTGPALRGACSYASDFRATAPDHQVIVLLLTDGRPEAPTTCRGGQGQCCPSLDDAVAAAGECRNNHGINTFVLGVGPLLDNLDQIAVAGGTERAFLVQGSGDVGSEVLAALNRIRGNAAIPCELALPEAPSGDALRLDAVNLDYEASSCALTPFAAVASAADCGDEDGWHYDDPDSPQRILLCPASCDRVSGPGGNLYYSVGCDTRIR